MDDFPDLDGTSFEDDDDVLLVDKSIIDRGSTFEVLHLFDSLIDFII